MKQLYAAVLYEDGNITQSSREREPERQTHLLDQLLLGLMQTRAAMQPPPSREPPQPGSELQVIPSSFWRLDLDLAGDVALSLHHPALGLLSWHLPQQQARELATRLQALLDEQDQQPIQ